MAFILAPLAQYEGLLGHSFAATPLSVDRIRPGTHMCLIYNDEAERVATIGRFLAAGLRAGGTVAYFGTLDFAGPVAQQIREHGADPDDAALKGRFSCTPARAAYAADGRFDVPRMLDALASCYCACRARASGPVLVSGEMDWALDPAIHGTEALARYEQAVNRIAVTHPLSAICQYDASRFDAAALYAIMKAHPFVLTQGQIVSNPLFAIDDTAPLLDRLAA